MNRVYTEEEAKKKMCPSLGGKCVASECMAWRWEEDESRFSNCGEVNKGYCGLAGKP